MNGSTILILNKNLNITGILEMKNTEFCSTYMRVFSQYLIFCDRYFLLSDGVSIKLTYNHNLPVSMQNKNNYKLQYDELNATDAIIFVLVHGLIVNIYHLAIGERSMEYLTQYSFNGSVYDFSVVDSRAIVLHDDCLCMMEPQSKGDRLFSGKMVVNMFNLSQTIPDEYSTDGMFSTFVPYFWSNYSLKGILFSQNVTSLHIDI